MRRPVGRVNPIPMMIDVLEIDTTASTFPIAKTSRFRPFGATDFPNALVTRGCLVFFSFRGGICQRVLSLLFALGDHG
jgi:hypothetical protein